ncbi:PadR family transcriptional regulator [Cytobacillus sp. Hz8]|uniref:PadR family transcriptional regulator n=1 Tax=Cytobacillus sp. Hz8 TaxID=3347168 RepID=UPI0035D6D183
MDERLKGLRKSMEKTVFKQLDFSNKLRNQVFEKINRPDEDFETVIISILQLLVHEKTGYELIKLLQARGIHKFTNNEGFLYTLLHRLEQTRLIISKWETSGEKLYLNSDKGKRILQKAERSTTNKGLALKELCQE